jgi:hypothetical protein
MSPFAARALLGIAVASSASFACASRRAPAPAPVAADHADERTDEADPFAAARAECVATVNELRATKSLPPLAAWNDPATNACVDGQATSDAASRRPHGAWGRCGEHAQNEAVGYPVAPESMVRESLQHMWAEGPGADFERHGHYLNMIDRRWTMVACGFHRSSEGDWWGVYDFR